MSIRIYYIFDFYSTQAQFPDVVAGFDLVGQEDLGYPLKSFASQLIDGTADPDLHYFLHAGETNWHGTDTDENLIDAILLNTTRIGHGFAIVKHPSVMDLARSRSVPVEICPISNQVWINLKRKFNFLPAIKKDFF